MRKIISILLMITMLLTCLYINIAASELIESGTVELYQLAPEDQSLMESYVIKTHNGKLIVIDGGIDKESAGLNRPPYLPAALRAIAGVGEGEYFEVEAWFLSHAHVDHFYELAKMLNEYDEESNYKINNFYFDFPEFGSEEYSGTLGDKGDGYLAKLKDGLDNYAEVNGIEFDSDTYYDEINGVRVNEAAIEKGLNIEIDDVEFEILQTWSNSDGTSINDTSMIFKMHAAGKSVLFLNDAYTNAGDRLLDTYGANLKSNIVQMAHHGQSGVDEDVYDAVDAEFFLWPTPEWVWNDPAGYAIDDVRVWITGEDYLEPRENDLVAGMYDIYPDEPTSVADWENVIDSMKITLTNESANYTAPISINYLLYNGEEQELIIEGSTDIGVMEYSLDGDNFDESIPAATDAGEYTVYYRITNGGETLLEKSLTVSIAKATPEFTAPEAKALIYNEEEQELITAGICEEGTFLYSLDDADYSADIPVATESGNYTVYYKVEESENYLEVSGSVDVTIGAFSVTFKNGNDLAPFDEEAVMTVMDSETLSGLPSYEAKANTAFAYFKIGEERYSEDGLLACEFTENTTVYAYFRETAITSCNYDFTTMTEEEFELTAFGTDSDFVLTKGVGIQLSKSAKTTYEIPLATDVTENALSVSYGFTETANTGGFDGHFLRGADTVAIFYHTSNHMRVYGDGAAQHIYNLGQLDDGVHHDVEFILDIDNERQFVVMDGFSGIVPTEGSHDLLTVKVPDRFKLLQKANGSFILESFGVKRLEDAKIREVTLSTGDGVTGISFMDKAESSTYTNTYIYMQEGDKVPLQATLSVGHELTGWSAESGSFSDETALKTVYTAGSNNATISAEGENSLAAEGNVALIGETGYKTLQEAADAATTGSTIYLLKDIEDSARITFNKGTTITVNGNGYTYTDTGSNGNGASTMLVESNTSVTFENITLTMTNDTIWDKSVAEADRRRVNGFFSINGGKLVLGDKAVLDGAAGANGGAVWMGTNTTSEFVLDGEGAVIKNVDTTYGHGIIAAYNGTATITIKNGTIENCTSTSVSSTGGTGCILKARSGKKIDITGGRIINNTVTAGAVIAETDGKLTISGNAVIKDNKTPSEMVDGKETGLLPLNVVLPDGTFIRVNDNFSGEVGVTSNYVQFAIASATGLAGLEGFYRDNTTYTGRYYVPGTKYATDAAKTEIEGRNEGRETAVIFDYPFSYVTTEDDDFLKKGVGAENWAGTAQNGTISYLLRDIGISDVANKGANASEGLDHYHINLAANGATFTYDGNGFEFKITDGNFQKKMHVFRLYNGVNMTLRNFIYDGSDIMGFVDAYYVKSDRNRGGNLTLDNCLIKNCLKANAGGAIRASDGKITIKDSVLDGNDTSKTGGTVCLCTPIGADTASELVIENSTIKNSTGLAGGAVDIQAGAVTTIKGTSFENSEAGDGGTIRVNGTLIMSDSSVKSGLSKGTDADGGGILVAADGVATIGGNTIITGNTAEASNAASNIHNYGVITLASDFDGNIGFTEPGTINIEAGLTSFEKVDSLFLDKDATKYPNITAENTISWELIPQVTVETDAGWYYTDNTFTAYASEKAGVVRFMTTFTAAPSTGCIVNYGTYALSADTDELGEIRTVATLTTNLEKVANGAAYIVDAGGIANGRELKVYGISFVTLKNIDTPVYFDTVSHTINANAKKLVAVSAE